MLAGTQNNKMAQTRKSLGYDHFQLKKIRNLYGMRSTLNLKDLDEHEFEMQKLQSREFVDFKRQDQRLLHVILPPNHNIFHKFIISPDAKWKTIFDVVILVLVAYSCITNILFITLPISRSYFFEVIFWIVELFFYFDFVMNWF